MTDTVSLTIKIDPALKETLKTFALENQISLSQEVTQRLQASLDQDSAQPVDNLNLTEEAADDQLTASELKQIRVLLKKSKKKK
ncbi:hypothetical protein [Erwinia mallotivora]|uniref:Arc-like DNA binding domain-containing protein n=1 Tax=Erwinia mallotivora TaxID=69222 RepID=A0A014NQZ4_9GAMM|nr:hypothetical protein [Erwinia mallotivora]EXU76235.1 hypothetical protein BG55_06485 [Erwinia mallotivora]